jgi:hypothetical protein
MSPVSSRFLFWSPRILSNAFAVFLSLFALDVFQEAHGFWAVLPALLMHLIPTFVVVGFLLAAWRWEWVGALAFSGAATLYMYKVLPQHPDWAAGIALPMLVIAALFLASWMQRRQQGPGSGFGTSAISGVRH